MLWSHIDAEGMCSMLRKLQQVTTSSTPYLKNRVAAMFAKFGHLIKPRIDRVALLLRQKQRSVVPMFNGKLLGSQLLCR